MATSTGLSAKASLWKGVLITAGGAALWGVSGTSMQYLTTTVGMQPALVTLLRVALGGLLYLAILLYRYRDSLKRMITSPKCLLLTLVFAASLYTNQLFYASTVQATNAGTATVLQMLECVFVMVFICVTRRRLPRSRELLGLILAFVATTLIATQGNLTMLAMPLNGLLLGLMTALTSSAYILIPDVLGLDAEYGTVPVIGMGFVLSILFAVPGYLMQGGSFETIATSLAMLSAFDWMVFLGGLVVLGTVVAYFGYLYGISLVGPVTGSILGGVEPMSATIMTAVVLGTAFSIFDVLGLILMCAMVFFITAAPEEESESSRTVSESANGNRQSPTRSD